MALSWVVELALSSNVWFVPPQPLPSSTLLVLGGERGRPAMHTLLVAPPSPEQRSGVAQPADGLATRPYIVTVSTLHRWNR